MVQAQADQWPDYTFIVPHIYTRAKVRLIGLGSYLPAGIITNDFFAYVATRLGDPRSAEDLELCRKIAGKDAPGLVDSPAAPRDESLVDMAVIAAQRALAGAGRVAARSDCAQPSRVGAGLAPISVHLRPGPHNPPDCVRKGRTYPRWIGLPRPCRVREAIAALLRAIADWGTAGRRVRPWAQSLRAGCRAQTLRACPRHGSNAGIPASQAGCPVWGTGNAPALGGVRDAAEVNAYWACPRPGSGAVIDPNFCPLYWPGASVIVAINCP